MRRGLIVSKEGYTATTTTVVTTHFRVDTGCDSVLDLSLSISHLPDAVSYHAWGDHVAMIT